MFSVACCLVAGLWLGFALGLDLVSGWLAHSAEDFLFVFFAYCIVHTVAYLCRNYCTV